MAHTKHYFLSRVYLTTPIVLDMNAIKDCNWVEVVYTFLVVSMNEATPKVQSRQVGCRSAVGFLNDVVVVLHVKITY